MKNLKVLNDNLPAMNGAEYIVQHPIAGLNFSSGVDMIRQEYECFWLVDAILLSEIECPPFLESDFYVWTLQRVFEGETPTTKFDLICDDGNGHFIGKTHIPFSDFAYDKLVLYLENDLLFLPAER